MWRRKLRHVTTGCAALAIDSAVSQRENIGNYAGCCCGDYVGHNEEGGTEKKMSMDM